MTPESELYTCMNYDGILCNRLHLRHCRDVVRRLSHALALQNGYIPGQYLL
jgi:hypothetical protein